jgi:hypothetical protein
MMVFSSSTAFRAEFHLLLGCGWFVQEPHLLHAFDKDFYGSDLRLLVCGYLRPEKNYDSLGENCSHQAVVLSAVVVSVCLWPNLSELLHAPVRAQRL